MGPISGAIWYDQIKFGFGLTITFLRLASKEGSTCVSLYDIIHTNNKHNYGQPHLSWPLGLQDFTGPVKL